MCYDCGELALYPDLRNNCRLAYLLQVPASLSCVTGPGLFLSFSKSKLKPPPPPRCRL